MRERPPQQPPSENDSDHLALEDASEEHSKPQFAPLKFSKIGLCKAGMLDENGEPYVQYGRGPRAARSKEQPGIYIPNSKTGKPERKEYFIPSAAAMSFSDAPELEEMYKAEIEERIESLRAEALPIPEDMQRFIERVKTWRAEHLREHGVKREIFWPEVFLLLPKREGANFCGGEANRYAIEIRHGLLPEQLERLEGGSDEVTDKIQKLREWRNLIHEFSHASPKPEGIRARPSGDNTYVSADRRGLVYDRRFLHMRQYTSMMLPIEISPEKKDEIMSQITPALEEGLARLAEKQGEELLKEALPEEYAEYERQMERLRQKALTEKTDISTIEIRVANTKHIEYGRRTYHQSEKFLAYLQESIPNFYSLALQAQAEDRTIALAHAVEKVFGPGAYKEVMLATEYSAPVVIENLEERKRATETGTLKQPKWNNRLDAQKKE